MQKRPDLFPVPRQVVWGDAFLTLPLELPLVVTGAQQELMPAALRFREAVAGALGITMPLSASPVGLHNRPHILVTVGHDEIEHEQGYRLHVGRETIGLDARTPAGAAYGLATLKQLMLHGGRQLPEVTVHDHPDFPRRGVMLDISRGKVPTMDTLYRFVDLLADLKLNEFQLYMEHTFAYREHREVWQHYSPMTGEEILALDRYCRERFIDLVPNQNSFGHLTPWLIRDRYKHLAETHDGWTAWGIRFAEPFSLCPLEPDVLPFVASLYDELLPHFSSPYFNVGCDETLDVGQGRSKEAVTERGEHRVYLEHLLKIYELVKARGKRMMFWGDIIVRAPELISELPRDVVALEWGYEADHPFAERCGHFAAAGIPFYVCPGASNWNSLAGQTDNALGNLLNAAENGLKHGAVGYLNTIWGDRGHQDYQPVTYLPVAYGAGVSWAVEANREARPDTFLNQHIFRDRTGQVYQTLYDLGNVYQEVGKLIYNGSVLGQLLHWGFHLPRPLGALTPADFDRAALAVAKAAVGLNEAEPACEDGPLILAELRNAVGLLLHACQFGKVKLALEAGERPDAGLVRELIADLDAIMAEHRLLWLQRNRPGGLEEMSLAPLRKLREGYQQLIAQEVTA